MSTVARREGVSVPTLRRRLMEERTTFAALVEFTRQDFAMRAIRDLSTSPKEIAFRLGYSEMNSFYRAFQRWVGMSPGRFQDLERAALLER